MKRLIVTIQDVIPFRFEEQPNYSEVRQHLAKTVGQMKSDIRSIITISEFSKKEISEVFNLDPNLISVIPDGVDHDWFKPIDEVAIHKTRNALSGIGINKPYILFLGGSVPRKNLSKLVTAFAIASAEHNLDHQLVIAGSPLRQELSDQINASPFKHKIVATGYLSNNLCLQLIQTAELLVFPSLYEGFGLPPLEAMACGVPVASSNAASLPEVCGDAALYFDPTSEEGMADCIGTLASDIAIRRQCMQRGLERAQHFSWTTMSRKTLSLYSLVHNSVN